MGRVAAEWSSEVGAWHCCPERCTEQCRPWWLPGFWCSLHGNTVILSEAETPRIFVNITWPLVGEISPFTFKVVIDMYVPITIFLNVLGLLL